MVEERHADGRELQARAPAAELRRALPPLSNAERAFWRHAVSVERSRIGCDRTEEPSPPTT